MKSISIALGTVSVLAAGLWSCSQQNNFKGATSQAAAPGQDSRGNPSPGPDVDSPELFKDCETSQSSKFVAKLYQIPENSSKLPNFSSLSPLREVCLKQLDIERRRFEDGFPGVDNLIEWFALDIYFDLKIDKAGDYTFRLNSDDGSRLLVDGKSVIENDGLHDVVSKEGTVRLSPGQHKMNVQYFQGPRVHIALELFWKPAGAGNESYLPLDLVSRPQ